MFSRHLPIWILLGASFVTGAMAQEREPLVKRAESRNGNVSIHIPTSWTIIENEYAAIFVASESYPAYCIVRVSKDADFANLSNDDYIFQMLKNQESLTRVFSSQLSNAEVIFAAQNKLGNYKALHILVNGVLDGAKIAQSTYQTIKNSTMYTFGCVSERDTFQLNHLLFSDMARTFEIEKAQAQRPSKPLKDWTCEDILGEPCEKRLTVSLDPCAAYNTDITPEKRMELFESAERFLVEFESEKGLINKSDDPDELYNICLKVDGAKARMQRSARYKDAYHSCMLSNISSAQTESTIRIAAKSCRNAAERAYAKFIQDSR